MKQLLFLIGLGLVLSAFFFPGLAEAQEVPWEVTPGGSSDTVELHAGPQASDACVKVVFEVREMPPEFQVFVQSDDGRWAFELSDMGLADESGIQTVLVELNQFQLKDPNSGALDPGALFDLASQVNDLGIYLWDDERDFDLTVYELVMADDCVTNTAQGIESGWCVLSQSEPKELVGGPYIDFPSETNLSGVEVILVEVDQGQITIIPSVWAGRYAENNRYALSSQTLPANWLEPEGWRLLYEC